MSLHWEDDAGADTTRARGLGESLSIKFRVEARRVCVASKVGASEAAEAALHVFALSGRCTSLGITAEHAKAGPEDDCQRGIRSNTEEILLESSNSLGAMKQSAGSYLVDRV